MNASELLEIIEDCESTDWDDVLSSMFHGSDPYPKNGIVAELAELGYVVALADSFGGEGQGDDYWGVFSVTCGDEVSFFKIPGWYASFSGAEMNGGFVAVEKVPVETYDWREL